MADCITSFTVTENSGFSREHNPISIGLPLPKGVCHIQDTFNLSDGNGDEVPAIIKPTAFWPDHSIKWLMIEASVAICAASSKTLYLRQSKQVEPTQVKTPQVVSFNPADKALTVSVSSEPISITVKFDKGLNFEISKQADANKLIRYLHIQPHLTAKLNNENETPIQNPNCDPTFTYETQYWKGKPLFTDISISIEYKSTKGVVIAKRTMVLCYAHLHGSLTLKSTLHNIQGAQHPDGKWDLGDPNSINIYDYGFNVTGPEDWQLTINPKEAPLVLGKREFSLHQESSGGKNWNSPNHVNKHNQVSLRYSGYEFTCDDTTMRQAKRAQPLICSHHDSLPVGIYIDKFWQNFPIFMQKQDNTINLGLFSPLAAEPVELQPGEKKTHNIAFNLNGTDCHEMQHPLQIQIEPAWIEHCNVIGGFSIKQVSDPLHTLILGGLDEKQGFFAKREWVDEYGWRNFGEVYADHETAGYKGQDIFVSHYNNQYDPLYGFLIQWLLTGDSRWFELANDLALHITDIDIYDTDNDKPEYAGGLFWHTDHYVPACTATHRTYSKHQPSDVYDDHAGGGGPGGQHCYTSGLLLHYWLTGSESSKQAVLALTNWITNVYEGDGTLFSFLLSLKNSNTIGMKNIKNNSYPLDRGTANYINSLIDSFLLTNSKDFLLFAERVMLNTASSADIINNRNLNDVENSWFYTVFLQACIKYLSVVSKLEKTPQSVTEIINIVYHYSNWMLKNEHLYLDNPEKLEFPNQTWSGQDLRKVQILISASSIAENDNKRIQLQVRAEAFKKRILDWINDSTEQHYSRVLALLIQNSSAHDLSGLKERYSLIDKKASGKNIKNKHIKLSSLTSTMRNFSLAREISQLSKRFPQQKLIQLVTKK